MPRYTDESKEKVRDAVDFAELVSARTGELRRSGGDGLMGLCPFHDERSPSFSISPAKKLYHCFGCGEEGDVFKFVMETEGVDFVGALEVLADRTGVELELAEEDPQAAQRRVRDERLMELLERTAAFYVRQLWESTEAAAAREYLLGRGLTEATLRAFRVGWAPSQWDTVFKASVKGGYKAREAYDAGLVQRSQSSGKVYDRFRRRITFPLADHRGRVLGFGARIMDDGATRGPKYLNSPENELFHKGRIVYAADLARSAAAKAGKVIVCEGYTDVLMLHQAGLRNTVACMGTSLTEEQVVALGRMAPTVVLALDADNAGQDAMVRAAKVAGGRKVELRVVQMRAGSDPAEMVVADGPDAMRALVDGAVAFPVFRVRRALDTGENASAEGKDRVIEELRPVFATLGPSVLQDELLRTVADRLDIGVDLVRNLLYGAAGGRRAPAAASGPPRFAPDLYDTADEGGLPPMRSAPSRRASQERMFLAYCLALPAEGQVALAAAGGGEGFSDPATTRAAAWLTGHWAAPTEGLPGDDPELGSLISELVARATVEDVTPARLEAESLQLQLARLERQMAAATGGRAALAKEKQALQARIGDAMARSLG